MAGKQHSSKIFNILIKISCMVEPAKFKDKALSAAKNGAADAPKLSTINTAQIIRPMNGLCYTTQCTGI